MSMKNKIAKETAEVHFIPDFKRMLYLPDGTVLFLSAEESDELMDSYQEMGIIRLFDGIMAVFDEEHVADHEGRRYIAGPVIIRTELDPMFETDLHRDEIREVFDRLEANEEMIRFGGVDIPVLALR